MTLRFDGKVVLVTGAGNGLGRAYAHAFAERGASVVVNDLGGSHTGSGASTRAADTVVEEIKSKGGKAVANYDSVEDGQKLIQTALDSFGRIDIIVNNAGILRDRSFARISDQDWDLINRVHVRGVFTVNRAAWPHMKKQGYGRIIGVSSAAGIYGNFGQANYSTAKLGIHGLTNTLAIEGRKNNIHCNTIAPIAGSRMTETVMSKDFVDALKPEYVAPIVLYLCHESCEETGSLFEVGGGWVGKLRWQRTEGVVLREKNKPITAELVRDKWNELTDFSKPTYPKNTQESNSIIMQTVMQMDEEEKKASENANLSPVARAKAFAPDAFEFKYSEKDAQLYALGVGVSTQQKDYLKFLFELNEDFAVLPSFGVLPCFASSDASIATVPGLNINLAKILHGEHYLELSKPLPRSGCLKAKLSVADIVDKKSGVAYVMNYDLFDENDEKVGFNQMVAFEVGASPKGGVKQSSVQVPIIEPPSRTPDATVTEKTSVDQAALYRLSGDSNPLHIDPSFAAMGGFSKPILHGLCTFGFSVRHVMAKFAGNDMARFKSVKVRFAKTVLPGQSLQTDMWKDGNRIYFHTKVVENGSICLSGAYLDLHPPAANTASVSEDPSELKCSAVFTNMAANVKSNPGVVSKINAVFQWNITKDKKPATTWIVSLKKPSTGEIYEGKIKSGKADCTITIDDADFVDLVSGKLNGQTAFMSGKMKLAGNMMLAQKLGTLFNSNSKM